LKKYKTEEDNYIRTGKHIKIIVLLLIFFLGMILCIKFSKKENSSNFKAIEKETLIQENNADYLLIISRKEIYDFQTDKKDAWIYIGRPSCPDCQDYYPQLLEKLKDNNLKIYYFNTECKASEKSNMKKFMEEIGITEIPSIIHIDKGKITTVYNCLVKDDLENLDKDLFQN